MAWFRLETGLQLLNAGIFLVGVLFFLSNSHPGSVLDWTSISLFFGLAVEVHILANFARNRADPFLTLLCIYLIVYYCLRLPSLLAFEDYTQFARGYFLPNDTDSFNTALLFIDCATPMIGLGLLLNPGRTALDSAAPKSPPKKLRRIVRILNWFFAAFLLLKFVTYFVFGWYQMDQAVTLQLRLIRYFLTAANDFVLLIAISVAWILGHRTAAISKRQRWQMALQVALYAAIVTSNGSRSAVLVYAIVFVCSALVVWRIVSVSAKFCMIAIAAFAVGVVLYPIATTFRLTRQYEFSEHHVDVVDFARSAIAGYQDEAKAPAQELYAGTFQRLSELDIFAEIVKNRDVFVREFDIRTVGRSVIDNLFTGGLFKIWHELRVSYQISRLYMGESAFSTGTYVSDAVTIFGDCYIFLGGWWSLLLIIPIVYIIKSIYYKIDGRNSFETSVWRACYLFWFIHLFLGSFGIDWWIIDGTWFAGSAFVFILIVRWLSIELAPVN